MESPETGRPEAGIAWEFPANDGVSWCSPPTMPTWLRKRLSEPKTPTPSTVEEIEAKLRDADLRRQKIYENLTSKARLKPRSPSRSSSNEDDPAQRLEAKLRAAEEKRLRILMNSQMRLAKLGQLRQAAKTRVEMRFRKKCDELGTKVETRVQQAEANRLLILRAYSQRRATLRERRSQSLMRRTARESKHKERVRAAIFQKRVNAEKKRIGLLEAEKRRAHARVLQVQKVANSVSHQRELERNEMKNKLEDKLQRARRKRAEYLKQRGGLYNDVLNSWGFMHEQDMLARKLVRCWRNFTNLKKTTAQLAKAYNELNINERSVKSMQFEHFAHLIQSSGTLNATKALLDRLEIRYKLSLSAANPCGRDDIDHLLKRVASPKRKQTPRKAAPRADEKRSISIRQAARTPLHLSRYQVRIVLCAYMILGHPDAVISGQGEREVALVKSAEIFVKEFDLLMKILLNEPLQISDEESDHVLLGRRTFRLQLAAFDSAWCSFLNSFVVWKAKDARSLEEDLINAACRLELSMIRTCKITAGGDSGPLSHDMKAIQKQVSEDQKLLREKVLHLSGDAGIERMENALHCARIEHFNAKEDGGRPTTPSTKLMSSLSPTPSSSGISDNTSRLTAGPQNRSLKVRPLFKDAIDNKEVTSPAIRQSSIPQFSKESLVMENVRIVNEYVHGEQLAFEDMPSSTSDEYQSNIMAKVKEAMENAFWDGIIDSVRQNQSNYDRIVELMREVRDGICSMAPHSWRQEIIEAIDLDILIQVLNSGNLDINYLGKILEYALITLRKLSAPAYEDKLKKKHQKFMKDLADISSSGDSSGNSQVIALVKGLQYVLKEMQKLKHEVSKARIRLLEPFLKGPDALYFLGKDFTSRYGHPSHSSSTLPLTRSWLSSVWESKDDEWNEHRILLSQLTSRLNGSSSFLPPTTLRTGGRPMVKSGDQADLSSPSNATNFIETIDPHLECKGEEIDLLVRLGLLKLVSKIPGLTEAELPETMNLNFYRLRIVQSQVQKTIVMATSLLVLRQTLLTERSVSSQAHMDNILLGSIKRLSECLDLVADAGVQDIIEILSSAIEEENKSPSIKLHQVKEIMTRMLTKSLQEDDPVFTRVSHAVYMAARGVVLGGTGTRGRELAELALQKVGAPSLLLDEVVQAASVLVTAAKVTVIAHGPWYANLLKS